MTTELKAYEIATTMLNAVGWNGDDFRLRDPVAIAVSREVSRINAERERIDRIAELKQKKEIK